MLVILALSTVSAKNDQPDENGFANLKLKKGESDPDAVASDESSTDKALITKWVSSSLISGALTFVFLFLFAYNAFLMLGAI